MKARLPLTALAALVCMGQQGDGLAEQATPAFADSVLRNGDFEIADEKDGARPAHWDRTDGLGVTWSETDPAHGKAIRMDTSVSEKAMVKQWKKVGITKWDVPDAADNAIAATYGLSFYSETLPVVSGQAYRVSFDYRGPRTGAKVWVRGYGPFRGEKRRRYETIVNCRVPDKTNWHAFSQVFHPTRLRPRVSEMKVMLYAYWPPAVYWFDNVRIEPVAEEP